MKTLRWFPWMAAWGGLFLTTAGAYAQGLAVIPAQSTWRYLENGLAVGTSWVTRLHDDSAWPSGPARLGFGGDGEQTLLQAGRVTYYFRRTFTVPNAASVSNLQVRLKRDDGAIVYLNGIEIFRSNMPGGPVDSLTPAASMVDGADETNVFISPVLTSSILADGTNVVAAEVHQLSLNSSDLGFDLELIGNVAAPTSLTVPVPAGWSTFANNFNRGSNTLNEVLPQVVDGTEIYRFNPATQSYSSSVYDGISASWTANFTLSPGEGAWMHSPVPQSITITGQIPTSFPVARMPNSSLRFVSCRQPRSSTFDEVMGFPPAEGDRVLTYEGSFPAIPALPTQVFTFSNSVWFPSDPIIPVHNSVFVNLVASAPTVVILPESVTVIEGNSATFRAVPTGILPFRYQWLDGGVPVIGATTSTITLPSLTNPPPVLTLCLTNPAGVACSVPPQMIIIPRRCLVINCPSNIVATCQSNGPVATYTVSVVNTCDSTVVNLPCNRMSGTVFPAGLTMVHCASNVFGQNIECDFTVTVLSNCPPPFIATLLAYDSFEYPTNTPVVGQNGGSGWTGAWAGGNPIYNYFTNQSFSLVPTALPDHATAGGSAAIDLPPFSFSYIQRGLDLATTNRNELWFSFVISPSGAAVQDRFFLYFDDLLATVEVGAYAPGTSLPTRWTIRQQIGAMGPIVQSNQPTLLVLQMTNISLTTHRFNLFVNPLPGPNAPAPDATYLDQGRRLDRVLLAQYIVDGGGTHHGLDEVRVAGSYADINGPQLTVRLPPVQFSVFNNRLVLEWGNPASEQLQAAENPAGPWGPVPGAGSPHVVDMLGPWRFFRVARP